MQKGNFKHMDFDFLPFNILNIKFHHYFVLVFLNSLNSPLFHFVFPFCFISVVEVHI